MVHILSQIWINSQISSYAYIIYIKMTITKVQIDRFRVISSKPFEAIVVALETAVGHPEI